MRKSINKTTVIIVLAVFLTLSVGYALFSDTVTIEGTATAQGNFDITATCQLGSTSNIVPDHVEYDEEGGYKNDSCVVVDDKITFSAEFEYPGANRYFTIKLTNNGTVAAKLDGPSSGDYKTYLECVDGFNGQSNGTIEENNECSSTESLFEYGVIAGVAFEDVNGNIIPHNETNQSSIFGKFIIVEDDGGYYVLEPGESMYVRVQARLHNKEILENSILAKSVVTYEYNFEQVAN